MPRDVTHRAKTASTGAIVAERLRVAATHWTRLRGLLGTPELPAGDGLWIRPCRQVHMFGMRYSIDVVFLDDGPTVVGLAAGLRPWRVSPLVEASSSVLELPLGTIERTQLRMGDRLEIEPHRASPS